jgi:succinoglycan biosynthesis protein ExoM
MTSIDVCICTYQRDTLLPTLQSLDRQILPANVTMRVIIADNDELPSARDLVASVQSLIKTPMHYIHAPARNIAIARNACLDAATAEWIAFIDDDEEADPHWLTRMLKRAQSDNLTAVFGPILAQYPDDTPDWVKDINLHTAWPEKRHGIVETGFTGNALLRRKDKAVAGKRFLVSKGRTGGEDTAFFFSIYKDGGRFGICDGAVVYESVQPDRLSYAWMAERRFRSGQSYGYHGVIGGQMKRSIVCLMAAAKALFCFGVAGLTFWSERRRNYWSLRGKFHTGVVSSFFGVREKELY